MTDREIRRMIASFPIWHYQFDLKGNLTPIFNKKFINRHEQRKRYIFNPLINLFGGSLAGKRILDLGCNAGFWSLCAIENEAALVVGVDGRQVNIDQANFVFKAKGIEKSRYEFVVGNIVDLEFVNKFGPFDIVLCLGVLYHINKPVFLLENISNVNSDILIIDTQLSRLQGSSLEIRHDDLNDTRSAVDYGLTMLPTRQAVLDIVQEFGYSAIILKPRFKSYRGAHSYHFGFRRAFLCTKKTDISKLSKESESINWITRCMDLPMEYFMKFVHRIRGQLLHNLAEK